jgi:hypothetical protein
VTSLDEAVGSQVQLAVQDKTAADTGAQSDHSDVSEGLVTLLAVLSPHFGAHRGISVVQEKDRNVRVMVVQSGGEVEVLEVGQVRSAD